MNYPLTEVSTETLNEIFSSIDASPTPELELRYLSEEFNFRTDDLYFLYLDHKKKARADARKAARSSSPRSGLLSSGVLGTVQDWLQPTLSGIAAYFKTNEDSMTASAPHIQERRKSSPQARLSYGFTKRLKALELADLSNKLSIPDNKTLKQALLEELSGYHFKAKESFKNCSAHEVLEYIGGQDFELNDLSLMVNTLVQHISSSFDVYIAPRKVRI